MPIPAAWGIDIGDSAIKAVKVAKAKESVEIVDIDIIPLKSATGEAESGFDRKAHLISALEEFARTHDPTDATVVASLPGRITLSKLVTLPPVEEKRLAELVRYEVQQQIPFPIDEIVWDYFRCGGEYVPGEETEVNLVAIRKDIVSEYVSNFDNAGIPVNLLQSAPIALYNFAKYEMAPEGNVVIIDVGAENTYLIIIEGDKFWLRTLPIAGKNITAALAEKFEIPFDEAERLKKDASKSKHSAQIFSVIKPILRELVGEIHRTIGFYKSLSKDVSFDRIIFMGNSIKLAECQKFFGENLPYRIQVLEGLTNIQVSRSINLAALRENLPGLAVAMGLAIQGVGDSKCKVNLLPESLKQGIPIGKTALLAGSVFLLLMSLLFSYLTSVWARDNAEQKAEVYAAGPARGVPSIQEIVEWQKDAANLLDKQKNVSSDIVSRYLAPIGAVDRPARILAEIQANLPRLMEAEAQETEGGFVIYRWTLPTDIFIIQIDMTYIDAIEVPGARPSAPKTKIPPYIQVKIAGLIQIQGDLQKTKDYIEQNFFNKLMASDLTVEEISQEISKVEKKVFLAKGEYIERKQFRTDIFNTRGYIFEDMAAAGRTAREEDKDRIVDEGKNGKYVVFLVKWNVSVDPTKKGGQSGQPPAE